MIKIGLIVNPIAGMGGRVGLKGTDGSDILNKAIMLGAFKEAPQKAVKALEEINKQLDDFCIFTYPCDMGEYEAEEAGIKNIIVLGVSGQSITSSIDTLNAAKDFLQKEVHVILFAGGDGTARDIYSVVGMKVPVIGIPAGVKIHSAVFATNSVNAGRLLVDFVKYNNLGLSESEVMDIDEDEFRKGRVTAKLYGYMMVPNDKRLTQTKKSGNIKSDKELLSGMSRYIADEMEDDVVYIIGSGSTTREIMNFIGLESTLLGIDAVYRKNLLVKDASEKELLKSVDGKKFKIVVSPIGGQGYIFGRGNQQISPNLIKRAGKENIIIVSSLEKLISLKGKAMLVDTGDEECDNMLKGIYKIIVGYGEMYAYYCC